MALDFPASPTVGQTFTDPQGTTWKWDGVKWTAATVGSYLPLSGGTMSGPLTLAADPTTALGAATKQYVDNGPAQHNVGRNLLHNGLFNIWQRGFVAWTASGAYTADRWQLSVTGSDTISTTGVGMADADHAAIGDESGGWFLRSAFTGTASGFSYVQQKIENAHRTAAKPVIVSFYARAASGAPKLGINLIRSYGTGGSPSGMEWLFPSGTVITLSTNWARYSATFAVPSAAGKVWGTNLDSWVAACLWYSDGNSGGLGNVGVQSGQVDIWGVQLEIAQPGQTQPTPLEKPDPQQELAKAQRFYQVGTYYMNAYNGGGATIETYVSLNTMMRAMPTVSPVSNFNQNVTGTSISINSGTGFGVYSMITTTGSGGNNGTWTASADL